ncbi:hypothetical protein PM082_014128 [Marasmius tenuissimus]|nr:hypothetical protein PM082_014128 [Marasmius tenuissimus]
MKPVTSGRPKSTTTFECDVCHFVPARKSDLKRHKLTHLDGTQKREISYSCQYCPYTSLQKYNLEVHTKSHTGQRDQQCPDCSFRTTNGSTLRRHRIRLHRKPLPASKVELGVEDEEEEGQTTSTFETYYKLKAFRHQLESEPQPPDSEPPDFRPLSDDMDRMKHSLTLPGIRTLFPSIDFGSLDAVGERACHVRRTGVGSCR